MKIIWKNEEGPILEEGPSFNVPSVLEVIAEEKELEEEGLEEEPKEDEKKWPRGFGS